MSADIQRSLSRLAASPPIGIAEVDFSIYDPEHLNAELGQVFNYFGRVENEVGSYHLTTMLPLLGTEYGGYQSHGRDFLDIWVPQEIAHGQLFDHLQLQLGHQPAEIPVKPPSLALRVFGRVAEELPAVHATAEMLYLATGAKHERTTALGYELMRGKLLELGETALAETMITPIMKQEAGHLGYYRLAAKTLRGNLSPWQLALARNIMRVNYDPVGVHNKVQQAAFGEVTKTLAGDDVTEFVEPVQKIAHELLGKNNKDALPKYVVRAFEAALSMAA